MSEKNIHVVKSDDGWAVKQEGNPNPVSVHQTQSEAIDSGRPLAQGLGGEFIIHGRDGKIREKDSYGNDPFPPRG